MVFQYLTRRGLKADDTADVTQETLIDVVRGIRNFDYQPERGRFRDWLATVVRRRLIKHWERSRRHDFLEQEPACESLDAEWLDTWQGELLRFALERLRNATEVTTWQAFTMTWLDGQSAAEVAEQLRMPIDLVYSAKSRTLRRLEAEIRDLGDDCVWFSQE